MDILDNLIYANCASALQQSRNIIPFPPTPPSLVVPLTGDRITSDYIGSFQPLIIPTVAPGVEGMPDNVGSTLDPVFSYDVDDKINFCAYPDPDTIERTIMRHWYDIDARVNYDSNGVSGAASPIPISPQNRYSTFVDSSTYHLIFAYLTENTRMLQIFERFIEKYVHDEEFGIVDNTIAFNWIQNSERLFFKNDSLRSSNIRSLIRPSADASRRNAYWRMFGMDLAFGDINSSGGSSITYIKAKTSNQQFIVLFEKYLSEVWQAYMNARNAVGPNSTDIDNIVSMARDLQELLVARRGTSGNSYANLNLSREEYSAVLMTSWFTFIISYDSPVVQFLNCQSSTVGERLIKIGNKVGIPAHRKSHDLFEMAGAASNILRIIEEGNNILNDEAQMTGILQSLIPPITPPATPNMNIMTDLLTIINYWEKATGHNIKNPQANITGRVSVVNSPSRATSSVN